MPTFDELQIWEGDGPTHVNYFRTYLRPARGRPLPSGAELAANMCNFMDAHTAKVWTDYGHRWNNAPTLMFRGKARVRPFVLLGASPIPLPDALAKIGVPEEIRTLMVPQLHTDSVGFAIPPLPHAFTVQTLKRGFETPDDRLIRVLVGQRVAELDDTWLAKGIRVLNFLNPISNALDSIQQTIDTWLGNYAVMINQHHFLAGRRSFRIGTVGGLGLRTPGVADSDWVFETAALERYSLATYGYATNLGMGGAARVVRPVWTEMGAKLAGFYGQMLGSVLVNQQEFGTIGSAVNGDLFHDVSTRHLALLP